LGVGFPGAVDFAHSNAIAVDDEHNVYISYRYVDTIHKVVGDPSHMDFGEVLWTLVGSEQGSFDSDFVLTSSADGIDTFGSPHHVRPIPGGIALYDNRWSGEGETRLIEIMLDESAGTADIVTAIGVGERCPIQGSWFDLPGGDKLTVCSGEQPSVFTVDSAGTHTWEVHFECPPSTGGRAPYRALPVTLP